MDTHCFLCEVGTCLIRELNEEEPSNGPCDATRAVSRRSVITKTMVRSGPVHVNVVVDQVTL